MGNSKNGKKGKNIKKAKECDNNHDFWVSREPECFICLQCCEGSLFSLPHWGLKSPHFPPHGGKAPVNPHFAPLFPKVDFPKMDFPKVELGGFYQNIHILIGVSATDKVDLTLDNEPRICGFR